MKAPDQTFPTCPPLPTHPTHLFLSSPNNPYSLVGKPRPLRATLPAVTQKGYKIEKYKNPRNTTIITKLTNSRWVTGRWRDRGCCARHRCRKRGRRTLPTGGVGREGGAGQGVLTTGDGGEKPTAPAATIPSVTALEIKAAKAPIETSPPEVVDGGGPEPPALELPRPEPPARELLAPTELPTLEVLAPEPPAPPLTLPTGAAPITPDVAVMTVAGTDTAPDEVTAINEREIQPNTDKNS